MCLTVTLHLYCLVVSSLVYQVASLGTTSNNNDNYYYHGHPPLTKTLAPQKHTIVPSPIGLLSAVSRRSTFFLIPFFLPVLPALSSAAVNDSCNNGTVVAESAVPGSYQQPCMILEEREVPLLSTGNTAIQVQQGQVAAGQTGVAVWNSALLLVRLLDAITKNNPLVFHDKTILELGCGTGVASIALSNLGASKVICTDGNRQVLDLAKRNVELNHASHIVQVHELQWGLMDAMDFSEVADIVVGSDLTYNSGTWRILSETLSTVLKPGGFVIYLTLGHAGFNVNGELSGFLQVSEGLEEVGDTRNLLSVSSLQRLLDTIISPEEMNVLQISGGARVVVLQKPVAHKMSIPK